jgi:hemerythrin-like domain-containing protein
MTGILESLNQDHVHMAQISALASHELARIEAGQTADLDLLEDIMCYVTGYPDTHHHPTEDVVFQQLKLRVPEVAGEIDAILSEHRQMVESGTHFLEAIRAVEEEAIMVRGDFVLAGRAYFSLLEQHMNVEESRLFPLAQSKLTVDDWQRLGERIEQRPDPLFGASLDMDFRRLRQRIEAHRTEHHDESN